MSVTYIKGNLTDMLTKTLQSNTFADFLELLRAEHQNCDIPHSPSVMVQPEPRAAWKAPRRTEECVPS